MAQNRELRASFEADELYGEVVSNGSAKAKISRVKKPKRPFLYNVVASVSTSALTFDYKWLTFRFGNEL